MEQYREGRFTAAAESRDIPLARALVRAAIAADSFPWLPRPREEVLILIARGGSTRQVANQLAITPKTAETHIERIYAKTGANTRSTATLFALQHGLLGTLEPLDL